MQRELAGGRGFEWVPQTGVAVLPGAPWPESVRRRFKSGHRDSGCAIAKAAALKPGRGAVKRQVGGTPAAIHHKRLMYIGKLAFD